MLLPAALIVVATIMANPIPINDEYDGLIDDPDFGIQKYRVSLEEFDSVLNARLGTPNEMYPLEANPEFCYPDSAYENHIEGKVRFHVTLDENFYVTSAEIEESVPSGVFDNVAKDIVLNSRYYVPQLKGTKIRPVFEITPTIVFKIWQDTKPCREVDHE